MPGIKTGILLVNLGTPDSSSTKDVRKYLREFLSDPRVIDIHPVTRFLLVNLIIAPFRAPRSAKLYQQIWTTNGSPLLWYTSQQQELLQQELGKDFHVEYAMRYQSPSIENALEVFRKPEFKKLIILPLFPQYASASTGSVHQKIMEIVSEWTVIPEIKFINSFYDDPGFIDAFCETGAKHHPENYDHVLFSFHGLPERQILKSDGVNHCLKSGCCDSISAKNTFCYRAQCYETARTLATRLNIPLSKYTVCFQSRLGKTPWIKPYSDQVILERAKAGDRRILAFSPAFVSDCLETIYEIGQEYDQLFRSAGGEKVTLVESLNDDPKWIKAMARMVTTQNRN